MPGPGVYGLLAAAGRRAAPGSGGGDPWHDAGPGDMPTLTSASLEISIGPECPIYNNFYVNYAAQKVGVGDLVAIQLIRQQYDGSDGPPQRVYVGPLQTIGRWGRKEGRVDSGDHTFHSRIESVKVMVTAIRADGIEGSHILTDYTSYFYDVFTQCPE